MVKPKGLNLCKLSQQYPMLSFESFEDEYFKGISGYNRLMMSEVFYRRFIGYEYILIYQLDAYIFKDELKKWCDKRIWLYRRPMAGTPRLFFSFAKTCLMDQETILWFVPMPQLTNNQLQSRQRRPLSPKGKQPPESSFTTTRYYQPFFTTFWQPPLQRRCVLFHRSQQTWNRLQLSELSRGTPIQFWQIPRLKLSA